MLAQSETFGSYTAESIAPIALDIFFPFEFPFVPRSFGFAFAFASFAFASAFKGLSSNATAVRISATI